MAKKKPADNPDRVIENRKARHDYVISDTLECGMVLHGPEAKSVREGKVSIAEGWIRASATPPELHAHGIDILPYGPAGPRQSPNKRTRVLLAHKREILKLVKATDEKGFTVVPLKLYFKNGFAKLLIGVAKGKQAHDKRQTIAKREMQRDINRAMSRRG